MGADIIEGDLQRSRHIVQAHCFPRCTFAQFNRSIDNLVSCWYLSEMASSGKKDGNFCSGKRKVARKDGKCQAQAEGSSAANLPPPCCTVASRPSFPVNFPNHPET